MENEKLTLPEAFIIRLKKALGNDFDKYYNSMKMPAVRGIRVNTCKISVEDFCKLFQEKIERLSFASDGFKLCSNVKTGALPESLAGLFYSQEPSSMLPVCASQIEKEQRPLKVLDLCASPGGKSGQIACRISEDSILFSNEIISSRADVLYSNIERQGFKNVVVTNEKPENLSVFKHYFDYVFVDAPCSGEGMFRKNPETILEWSEQNVTMCAARQKEILEVAQSLVAPGGKLIYSTCTFSSAEDEEVVGWLLKNHNYELVDVDNSIRDVTIGMAPAEMERARKFYPFCGDGEGQFVAVFKNLGQEENHTMHTKKHYNSVFEAGSGARKVFQNYILDNFEKTFAEELLSNIKGRLFEFKENLYLVPRAFNQNLQTALDELKFLSVGIRLGKVQKDRFEPCHAMFMAFGEKFKLRYELDTLQMNRYLHGEEIKVDMAGKGYVCMTAKGYAIGGAKLSDGRLKNLYPKGLRL